MAPKLEVTQGKNRGVLHKVKLTTRIGRELDNDVVLTDTKASRHHAEITIKGGYWTITDLGSYNQTYVNDEPITGPTTLEDGDRVGIGETEFTIRMPQRPHDKTAPTKAIEAPSPRSSSAPAPTTGSAFPWIVGAFILLLLVAGGIVAYAMYNQPPVDPVAQETAPPADTPTTPTTETVDSADPAPLVQPTELVVVYEEDFSDSFSGWDDAFDNYTRKVYGNARYQIEINTTNLVAWGLANRDVADFEVEVEAKLEQGDITNSYGLLFRFQDPENFYRFDISNDGYYLLTKFLEGQWVTLVDWTASPHINAEEANQLKVSAFGANITAWVNGHQLASVVDDSLTHGNFGFFAGTFGDPYMWVSFDDLILQVPAGDDVTIIPTATRLLAILGEPPSPTSTVPPASLVAEAATPEPTIEATVSPTVETPEATPEDTIEATEEATVEATEEPTEEATTEAAPEATATEAPTPPPLPEYASRDQPLARGEVAATGRIIFPLYDSARGIYDIYMADAADGGNRQLLQENASQPAVSRDGTEFAYRSWQGDRRGLFARPLSGGDGWHFTRFFEDAYPQFAPGSKTLLYHSRAGGREPAIYWVVNGEGQVLRRDGAPVQGEKAKWLPDGERFVYQSCIGGTCGLMIGDVLGSGPALLTDNVTDVHPEASPDGSSIVFMSQRNGNWDIFRMTLEGETITPLTSDEAHDGLPTWSPDGESIAFVSNRDGEWSMWSMSANGEHKRRLFDLDGSIDGIVQHDPPNSRGWTAENIIWLE